MNPIKQIDLAIIDIHRSMDRSLEVHGLEKTIELIKHTEEVLRLQNDAGGAEAIAIQFDKWLKAKHKDIGLQ